MSGSNTPEPIVITVPSSAPKEQVSITFANLPLDTLRRYSNPKPLRRPQLPRQPSPETDKK